MYLRVKLQTRYLNLTYCCFLNEHIYRCPEEMKVKVKIEGCGVLHKMCQTENSFPLYNAETISVQNLTLKWNFVAQELILT